MRQFIISFLFVFALMANGFSQDQHKGHDHSTHDHSTHNHAKQDQGTNDHSGHNHGTHDHSGHNHGAQDHSGHNHGAQAHHHGATICGAPTHHEFDAGATAIHHIGDANVYSVGPWMFPLPCILYSKEDGINTFLSSKFKFERMGHGSGHQAVDRYVLDEGTVRRITDPSFPKGEVPISGFVHKEVDKQHASFVCHNNKLYATDAKSTADGGLFGGGITSFYDFSITKNVTSMFLVCSFLFFLFTSVARSMKKNAGMAPKGLQNFMEPLVDFIKDEVAIPFLGPKYQKFLPFLLTIFFFILGLNLFGQIPFFGGSNVTGNLAVTAALAIFVFIMTNINGNADYWKHLGAPGTPWFVKIILIPVEILGLFIKPLTLMLRLFANITAGHMVVVIFVSFIFIFGKNGQSPLGAGGGAVASTLLTLFMMAIELIVAFLQAFVFTLLTASYLGAATEEHHHHGEAAEHH